MPINPKGFHLFSKEFSSTYPQNIAYKAVQTADPEKAEAFLRRMREATETEAKVTSNPDVKIELMSEVGIDIVKFIKAIRSSEAEKRFKGHQAITQSTGIRVSRAFW